MGAAWANHTCDGEGQTTGSVEFRLKDLYLLPQLPDVIPRWLRNVIAAMRARRS